MINYSLKFFVFFIIILFPFSLFAQNYSIKGHVVDADSGETLPIANVLLLNLADSSLVKGTITNTTGDFSIQRIQEKTYVLTVSYLGYRPVTIRVEPDGSGATNTGNIALEPEFKELNEIIVEWKPLLEYGDEGSVSLNLEKLGSLEKLSVADAMESIPGFYFDFDDQPVYNGISNYTLLIDGERIGRSFYMVGSNDGYLYTLQNIPARYIKKVEIYPEPLGKYGFYTPIINLVPNGNLMDTYNAHAGIGSRDKYVAGADFSRKAGRFTFSPETEYADKSEQTTTYEDRVYEEGEGNNNFSRKTIQHRSSEDGNLGLSVRYKSKKNGWLTADLGGKPGADEAHRKEQTTSYISTTELEQESYHSNPESYKASLTTSWFFNLPKSQMVRLSSNLKYNFSAANERQNLSNLSNLYQQKTKKNNTNGNIKASYSKTGKKFRWFFDFGLNYQNTYNFAARNWFNPEEDEWSALGAYSQNKRLQRFNSDLNLRVSRNFKNDKRRQSLRLSLAGTWNNDRVKNYMEAEKTSNDNIRTNNSLNYWNSNFLKQMLRIDYKYNVAWPSSDQLMATPVYIDEQTMRLGNPDLKPETKIGITLQLQKGFDPNASYLSRPRIMNWGYSLNSAFEFNRNKIESSQALNENDILVYSFANNDRHSVLTTKGNVYYNFWNKIKMYWGGEFTSEKYNDNPDGYQNGQSWNTYTKLRTNILFDTELELKYRYNSSRVAYRSKIHDYEDASVSISRHFLKNNLRVQLEMSDILSKKGIRTEYFGDHFYSNKIVRGEYPVLWMRVSYVLFSFYSRKELD